jgi:tRNA 2-(methylsulfanyl)-N6-isopentenyladenosine37 hydroxylase
VKRAGPTGIADVLAFLSCSTPQVWFDQAPRHLPTLLIDHANCEKKAAGTALSLLFRYVDKPDLLQRLSRLAREELRHFEQVHDLLVARGIDYVHLSPSRYAAGLMACVRPAEPFRLVDTLLMGAVVEARSCERFAGLAEVVPNDLADFYRGLLAAEARHFRHYLDLAERYAAEPVEPKLRELLTRDAELVTAEDTLFRFHSGPLATQAAAVRAGSAGS